MSARRVAAIRVLVLALAGTAVAGVALFGSPEQGPAIPYENARKSLPVLEALAREQVSFLRDQDWCRAYSDGQEKRASTLSSTCTLDGACSRPSAGCGHYQLFDGASETRFAELRSTLNDLPYDVSWIKMESGPDGVPRTAEMAIDTVLPFRRDAIVYDPGYTLPRDIPGEVVNHRIDSDWYYRWEDWN